MLDLDRILVPTDFSDCAEEALRHATRLAPSYDAELHLLHVIPVAAAHPMLGVQATPAERTDRVLDQLNDLVDRHDLDELPYDLAVEHGDGAAPTILDYADGHDVDLLVLGTHGRRGVERLMLGSEAEEVLRQAPRPVLAVRQGDEKASLPPERLLVPVDLSEHSRRALHHATRLAAHHGARLDLVHVIEPMSGYDPTKSYEAALPDVDLLPSVKKDIRRQLHALADELPLPDERVRVYVEHGPPIPFIVDIATDENIDLIVLSSHGRTGLERFFLGSVTEKVLRTAPCPVFVVKAHGQSLLPSSEADGG